MNKHTLEMAAKAAGYTYEYKCDVFYILQSPSVWVRFEPYLKKSDFYDLAEAIGAIVDFEMMRVTTAKRGFSGYEHEYAHNHNKDIKHALVALAARIGEAME